MRTFALAATTAVAALLASTAHAAIFISFDGSTSVFSQAFDGVFEFTADCGGADDCGGFETVTVEGSAPLTLPGLLHTDNVSVNALDSGEASITIWVTRTGLSVPFASNFFSSFTSNNQGGAVDVHLETLISTSNELFGGVLLSEFDHNAVGADSFNEFTAFSPGAGTFSVTERYTLTAIASSFERSASPTITLATAPIPEPATWALMIMGFGGAGAMMRRRRATFSAA